MIDFRGGAEPTSKWTISFDFSGLAPDTAYDVAVQGRTGEDGSPEAATFTPLCAFRASATGTGGCWHYLVGLRRLGVVRLRLADASATAVMQATRAAGGPGAITTTPNAASPASPPVPAATPPPATPQTTSRWQSQRRQAVP